MQENNEFEVLEKQLRETQDEICELRNNEYKLNQRYIELLKEKCRKNIGRCFKMLRNGQVVSYCKVISIDNGMPTMDGRERFNAYQYPALWFDYPYRGSELPYYEDNLFSGAWGHGNAAIEKIRGISYEEISKNEFIEKFNEVNATWIQTV